MNTPHSDFGRRSHHQFIVARGEKVRSVSMPPWAVWTAAACCVAALFWLVGSTAYIAFHDDIYDAAKAHRISVERAYEDRIAALRRQIDEINTRQFLDQQAFETRLEALMRKQSVLEERHQEIAALYDGARARKLTINLDGNDATGPLGDFADADPGTVRLTTASIAAFDPSRPAPLDPQAPKAAPVADADLPPMERVQASIGRVSALQDSMLDALETTVGDLSGQLAAVGEAIGADLPVSVEETGMGGPLIELRRMATPNEPDEQISRIREEIDRFDTLRAYVRTLPVRSPIRGKMEFTSGFGTRLDPFLKRPALHTGLDFRAATGTPIYATAEGAVTTAAYSGGYGRMVEIDHGNGYSTRYGHMSRIAVAKGDYVAAGDLVGYAGSSGRSTGPHLHYETRVNGSAKDPLPFVRAAKLVPEGF